METSSVEISVILNVAPHSQSRFFRKKTTNFCFLKEVYIPRYTEDEDQGLKETGALRELEGRHKSVKKICSHRMVMSGILRTKRTDPDQGCGL